MQTLLRLLSVTSLGAAVAAAVQVGNATAAMHFNEVSVWALPLPFGIGAVLALLAIGCKAGAATGEF